jgi:hypothetical protein
MRGVLLGSLLAALALPCAAQTDDQTKELIEKERRIYEQKTRQANPAAPNETADAAKVKEEQRAEVARFIADADKLIRDRNFAQKSTPHFQVQTDDPRLDPGAAAALLESFRAFFASFWEGKATLRPYESPGRIYLFYSYFKYNQLLTGHPRFDPNESLGHYRPIFDVVVIHTDPADPGELPDALVHEAAHQLIVNQLLPEGTTSSLWLAEGLASYFGYTLRTAPDRFEAGAIGGKGVALLRGERNPAGGDSRRLLQELRGELRRDKSAGVAHVLDVTQPGEFYGEKSQANYARAWMLVHYLLHGEDERFSAPFVRYFGEEAAGRGGAESLLRLLGVSAAELDAGFRAYVLDLKDGPPKRTAPKS